MARLIVCWLVSCWMLVRKEQRRRRRAGLEAERRELEDAMAIREQERQHAARPDREADLGAACAAAQPVAQAEKGGALKVIGEPCAAEEDDKRISAGSRAE